jgi:hypothetical protein
VAVVTCTRSAIWLNAEFLAEQDDVAQRPGRLPDRGVSWLPQGPGRTSGEGAASTNPPRRRLSRVSSGLVRYGLVPRLRSGLATGAVDRDGVARARLQA